MSAETYAFSTLSGAAAVTALVGSGSACRVYPDFKPQEHALPAVAYTRVETENTVTIHTNAVIASRAVLELWALAETRAGAEALADAIETAIATSDLRPIGRRADLYTRDEGGDSATVVATVITVDYWDL